RAHGKLTAARCEHIECLRKSGKRSRPVGQMIGIVRNEVHKHLFELGLRKNVALGLYSTGDHRLGAIADQIARSIVRQQCQTFAREYYVKGLYEIWRRVDQG